MKHRSLRTHSAFRTFTRYFDEASFRGEKRDQRRPLPHRINIISSSQSPRAITGSSPRLMLEFRRSSLLSARKLTHETLFLSQLRLIIPRNDAHFASESNSATVRRTREQYHSRSKGENEEFIRRFRSFARRTDFKENFSPPLLCFSSPFVKEKLTCTIILRQNSDREFFVTAVRLRQCCGGCNAPRINAFLY